MASLRDVELANALSVTGEPEIGRGITPDQELRLLVGLCRELAARGRQVGMRDSLPALAIPTNTRNGALYVYVSKSGEFYEWNQSTHPVDDPKGAAQAITLESVRHWG